MNMTNKALIAHSGFRSSCWSSGLMRSGPVFYLIFDDIFSEAFSDVLISNLSPLSSSWSGNDLTCFAWEADWTWSVN